MSWSHVEDKLVKANKEHTCLLCALAIEVGTVYVRRFGFDERPVTMKMHPACERFTKAWEDIDWETPLGFPHRLSEIVRIWMGRNAAGM